MKHNKKLMAILGIILIVTMMAGYFDSLKIAYAYTAKSGYIKVEEDSKLNVRTGPGTSNDVLLNGTGEKVQLANGHDVTVVGEDFASDGKRWYKITFKYTDGVIYTGYIHSDYIVTEEIQYEEDKAFEKYLKKQNFPESYKDALRLLHAKYPNWVFEADHLEYDWEEVVKAQSKLGRNLVYGGSISSWKSTATGAFDWLNNKWIGFDGASWVAASGGIVSYYLDPRNFLDENYIFQFEALSYNEELHTEAGLFNVIKGTFLENGVASKESVTNEEGVTNEVTITYAQAIMDAAKQSGVSPYHLAASIIQEQGSKGGSDNISGTVDGYESIYNFYNWGAYAANGNTAVINGLIYSAKEDEATMRPWNTKYKSIVGGAIKKGTEYINIGQDTQYYIKFDFVDTPYTHQYMTNIQAAASEGYLASKAYTDEMKAKTELVFKIPVFENMPETNVKVPTKTGNPNNRLSALTVSGVDITPTFEHGTTSYSAVVTYDINSVDVAATTIDKNAVVSGIGTVELKEGTNNIIVSVVAENGTKRNYTITIIKEAAPPEPEVPEFSVTSDVYKTEGIFLTGIQPGTSQDVFLSKFNVVGGTIKTLSFKKEEYTGFVGTGRRLFTYNAAGEEVDELIVLVYGDVTGEGDINIIDLATMKKYMLGAKELSESAKRAGDINKADDGISIIDYAMLKKHILGSATIEQ